MLTCSFIVKGPGFKDTPNILQLGIIIAHRRPKGKESNWATSYKGNQVLEYRKVKGDIKQATNITDRDRRITEKEELI